MSTSQVIGARNEWVWWPNDIRGPWGPKASRHLSYRWGKTPKNFTQETFPDRGSNPGPLRDRRACYHLVHSGGLYKIFNLYGLLVSIMHIPSSKSTSWVVIIPWRCRMFVEGVVHSSSNIMAYIYRAYVPARGICIIN